MRNIFLLVVLSLGLFSCKDRDQDPNTLPGATQTGQNTGGAIVDGKVWVAKIEKPWIGAGVGGTSYRYVNNEYELLIILRNIENTSGNGISFYLTSNQDFAIGEYQLNDTFYNRASYYDSKDGYFTGGEYTGVLKITNFDKVKQIVSGTFSFKANSSNGKVTEVTEGRFDKKYYLN